MSTDNILVQKFRRIYVVGGTGSGKSLAAGILSATLRIPWYDLDGDDVYSLTHKDRKHYLQNLMQQDQWICEADGIAAEWVNSADITLVISTPRLIRVSRILKRALLKSMGKQFKGQLGRETCRTLAFRLALTWRYEKDILNPYINKNNTKDIVFVTDNRKVMCRLYHPTDADNP